MSQSLTPAPEADSLLPPAQAGESCHSPIHLKLKILLLINSPAPPNFLPKINISPPLRVGRGSVSRPAPLEGQPPSVRNRSLTPQAKTPVLEFQHIRVGGTWCSVCASLQPDPQAMGIGDLCANVAVLVSAIWCEPAWVSFSVLEPETGQSDTLEGSSEAWIRPQISDSPAPHSCTPL